MNVGPLLLVVALEIVVMIAPYHRYSKETLRFLLSNSTVRPRHSTVVLLARLKPARAEAIFYTPRRLTSGLPQDSKLRECGYAIVQSVLFDDFAVNDLQNGHSTESHLAPSVCYQ